MTDCKWDKKIPLEKLWPQIKQILKPNGASVFTSIQPFTTELISSNRKDFKYCWYWIKNGTTGFCFSKYQPMRCVEDICVFYNKAGTYNPQGLIKLESPIHKSKGNLKNQSVYKSGLYGKSYVTKYRNYPKRTLYFDKNTDKLHTTQKPVALFEYFVKTYTNPGDVVLDCCMGSGTTAAACIATGRKYIGFEIDKNYYEICTERVKQEIKA